MLYNLAEPTHRDAATSAPDEAGSVGAERRRDLILIVEDDFLLRQSLADFFTAEGYEVESAADGLEALIRLESSARRPWVILLDLTMPRMDGIRFLELQRSLRGVASIPVIAVTGKETRRSNLAALGFREAFFKPLNLPKLLETIRGL